MVVQGSSLCAPNAGVAGSIPGWGTKILSGTANNKVLEIILV